MLEPLNGTAWRPVAFSVTGDVCSNLITTDMPSPKMLSHLIFFMPFLQCLVKVKVNCQIYEMIFKSLYNTFLLKVKVVKYMHCNVIKCNCMQIQKNNSINF